MDTSVVLRGEELEREDRLAPLRSEGDHVGDSHGPASPEPPSVPPSEPPCRVRLRELPPSLPPSAASPPGTSARSVGCGATPAAVTAGAPHGVGQLASRNESSTL